MKDCHHPFPRKKKSSYFTIGKVSSWTEWRWNWPVSTSASRPITLVSQRAKTSSWMSSIRQRYLWRSNGSTRPRTWEPRSSAMSTQTHQRRSVSFFQDFQFMKELGGVFSFVWKISKNLSRYLKNLYLPICFDVEIIMWTQKILITWRLFTIWKIWKSAR